jgi:hypothetical protein
MCNTTMRDVPKPDMPTNWCQRPSTWLSDRNISQAMSVLSKLCPRFVFCGILMRDFDRKRGDTCLSRTLSSLDLCSPNHDGFPWQELREKRSLAGFVINSDVSSGSGIHWTSLLFCFDRESAMYGVAHYDSLGKPPLSSVRHFMTSVSSRMQDSTSAPFPVRFNRGGPQKFNSECGVYCMMFLYGACLSGCDFDEICAGMPGDVAAQGFRRVIFKPSCPPYPPRRPRSRSRSGAPSTA